MAGAQLTLPAINCPKPGGNVSVETIKVTSAGYSRRLQGGEQGEKESVKTHKQSILDMITPAHYVIEAR